MDLKKEDQEEITIKTNRTSAVPLDPKYAEIWKNYKLQQSTFWVAGQIKFEEDRRTYKTLPEKVKESYKKVFGYFANSDEIVEEYIDEKLKPEIKIPEITYCLGFQAMMENIHSEVYNTAIEIVIPAEERKVLYNATEYIPTIKAKADWAKKWFDTSLPLQMRCVAWAAIEGLHFSSSFAFIDWMKTQKYNMPGTYESNTEISRDEARHTASTVLIHSYLAKKATRSETKEILDDAIKVEFEFVNDMLPSEGYNGMNRDLMKTHIYHCANIVASQLGHDELYGKTHSPFSFVVNRGMDSLTNFFESTEGNYSISGAISTENEKFEFLDDF